MLQLLTLALCIAVAVLIFLVRYYQHRNDDLLDLQEELREQREAVVDMLNRLGMRINASLDLDGALEIIADYLVEATKAESGAVFLLDSEGRHLQVRALKGLFPPLHETTDYVLTKRKYLDEFIKKDTIEIGEGIIGFVAKTGESLLIRDALADPRVPKVSTDYLQINSMIIAPMRVRQRILGVFALVNRRDQESFGEQDLRLLQQLSAQAALTVDIVRLYEHEQEERRLEQELRVAHEFQRMLLPTSFPDPPGWDIWAYNTPALELGGDHYDFLWVEEGRHLGIAIVDVSGKGIPGALVMTILRSALRTLAPGEMSPRNVLTRANRSILADTKENVFITVTYLILDVKTGCMRFCRAGHEPLIVCNESSDRARVYQPNGIALGLVGDEIYDILEEEEVVLRKNDTVLLYTDGVVEAVNGKGEEYGTSRFLARVQENRTAGPETQVRRIVDDIRHFSGGIPQLDDITLVAFKANNIPEPIDTDDQA